MVPEVLRGGVGLPVPRPLFRPVDGSSGIHTRHGPGLLNYALLRVSDPQLLGRLASPGILFSGDRAGEGLSAVVASRAGDSGQSSQELLDSHAVHRLSRHEDSDFSFEGFPDLQAGSEAGLLDSGIPLRSSTSAVSLASAFRGDVFGVVYGSGSQASHEVPSAAAECGRVSPGRRGSSLPG